MERILLTNGIVYSDKGTISNGWLLIEAGKIVSIGDGTHPMAETILDMQQRIVLPGFIDLHVHGAVGCSTMHATPESIHTMARFFAQHGVTGFLAATITASSSKTVQAIANIAACIGRIERGATLLGAYLEGAYISEHAKGAHDVQHIRRAHAREYNQLFETKAVKQITVAPEYPENMQLIKDCVAQGIMPAIGHTMATYDQACHAINIGATQATHTFNAMSAMHHRAPGAVGAVLTHDAITCEIIADMVHVHPAIVTLAMRAKGFDKIVLITDAEAGAGMEPGTYTIGDHTLQVTSSGVYLKDGTLAGSVLTMNKALYNCVHVLGISLADAWPMTSFNAAKQIGLDHTKGKLAVGYDADIAVLNPADYSVEMTLCSGQMVYTQQKNILFNERNNERSNSWPTKFV